MHRRIEPAPWERVAHELAEDRTPWEIWAEARREGDLELGLALVDALLCRAGLVDAGSLLAELESLVDGPRAAVVVVLRQRLRAATDQPLDLRALADALEGLLAAARWADVLVASSLLADEHANDLAAVRRYRAIAIGAAEAGGAVYTGAVQLRLLAAAELAGGNQARCLAHLEHALRRLDGVLLLGARFEQARCYELAGDANASAGQLEAARECYEQALDRFSGPNFGAAHRKRVASKRRALG